MFVHWGLYSQIARHEWVMNFERIPRAEYEQYAATWKPKQGAARAWAALAKQAGMKYMVLTTKHHEGFCLWDTKMTDYNAVKHGPGRDLVREYVAAAREFGLRVGLYYSLMDWHHPDGIRCATDEAARQRFVAFTHGCVRELMSNYGKIDILWYDVAYPLSMPEQWESYRLNAMVRALQPAIIINDRSCLAEDFGTPEDQVTAAAPDRSWEACMRTTGSWGYTPAPPEDWPSSRQVLDMLRTCTAGAGNLLLNIGPKADGSLPPEAAKLLQPVGRWLAKHKRIVYGRVNRAPSLASRLGNWTRRGKTYYVWCHTWPGREFAIAGLTGQVAAARLYPQGKKLPFHQIRDRLVVRGLPAKCPEPVTQVGVIELRFRTPPNQIFDLGCQMPEFTSADLSGKWCSPPVRDWQVSVLCPKQRDVATAPYRGLKARVHWQPIRAAGPDGFVNVHERVHDADGIVYLANRFVVKKAGSWTMHLGHDGGARAFVDGRSVLIETKLLNPALPGRSHVNVKLSKGAHEIVIAFDTVAGRGWGIYFSWELPKAARRQGLKPRFPTLEKESKP
jgi:alpha-L-fucosidase